MNKLTLTRRAELFAREAHKFQFRDGGEPYIIHPEQVAELLSNVTQDENIIAAGWLHDVIEDCGVTRDQLAQAFNETIADLVVEVTHVHDGTRNTFPNLKTREGVMIKFADRLSNLSSMNAWNAEKQDWYIKKSKFWS